MSDAPALPMYRGCTVDPLGPGRVVLSLTVLVPTDASLNGPIGGFALSLTHEDATELAKELLREVGLLRTDDSPFGLGWTRDDKDE
jgi:hypothetical protein